MRQARRVRQDRIRRLYRRFGRGMRDDDLLDEVGWGLYARAEAVLTVWRAYYRGEVPCDRCDGVVARAPWRTTFDASPDRDESFACPHCDETLTWRNCRDALRDNPLCFDCMAPLRRDHQGVRLFCDCGVSWTWRAYRQSVGRRVRLPCPHCNTVIRRPPRSVGSDSAAMGGAGEGTDEMRIPCPKCGGGARHAPGKLLCDDCGYEQRWEMYKRRVERLRCAACGHEFTWRTWRRGLDGYLITGNPAPVRRFAAGWPECRSFDAKMIHIDSLLHSLHGGGALAPVFIVGTESSVRALLDDLANDR